MVKKVRELNRMTCRAQMLPDRMPWALHSRLWFLKSSWNLMSPNREEGDDRSMGENDGRGLSDIRPRPTIK